VAELGHAVLEGLHPGEHLGAGLGVIPRGVEEGAELGIPSLPADLEVLAPLLELLHAGLELGAPGRRGAGGEMGLGGVTLEGEHAEGEVIHAPLGLDRGEPGVGPVDLGAHGLEVLGQAEAVGRGRGRFLLELLEARGVVLEPLAHELIESSGQVPVLLMGEHGHRRPVLELGDALGHGGIEILKGPNALEEREPHRCASLIRRGVAALELGHAVAKVGRLEGLDALAQGLGARGHGGLELELDSLAHVAIAHVLLESSQPVHELGHPLDHLAPVLLEALGGGRVLVVELVQGLELVDAPRELAHGVRVDRRGAAPDVLHQALGGQVLGPELLELLGALLELLDAALVHGGRALEPALEVFHTLGEPLHLGRHHRRDGPIRLDVRHHRGLGGWRIPYLDRQAGAELAGLHGINALPDGLEAGVDALEALGQAHLRGAGLGAALLADVLRQVLEHLGHGPRDRLPAAPAVALGVQGRRGSVGL